MDRHTLTAQKRALVGKKVKRLRQKRLLPANIYGKGIESLAVTVTLAEFSKVYHETGETGLIDLTMENDSRPVLVHEVQLHPVTHDFLHVDFFQVDLRTKVKANVPIEISGTAPAVDQKLGVLLELLDEIVVETLPANIPEKMWVDVSNLQKVGDTVFVKDLRVPHGVVVLTDGEMEVVKIDELISKKTEEELAQAETAAQAAPETTEGEVLPQEPPEGAPQEESIKKQKE